MNLKIEQEALVYVTIIQPMNNYSHVMPVIQDPLCSLSKPYTRQSWSQVPLCVLVRYRVFFCRLSIALTWFNNHVLSVSSARSSRALLGG